VLFDGVQRDVRAPLSRQGLRPVRGRCNALLWPVVAFALYLAIAIYYIWPRGLDSDLADADA